MSHTPGPWEMGELVDHDQDGAIFVDGYQVAGPAGCYVDAEADARLIATAPELLEVVEVAQGSLCGFICWHSLGSETKHSDICLRLVAVIAKAKGA